MCYSSGLATLFCFTLDEWVTVTKDIMLLLVEGFMVRCTRRCLISLIIVGRLHTQCRKADLGFRWPAVQTDLYVKYVQNWINTKA